MSDPGAFLVSLVPFALAFAALSAWLAARRARVPAVWAVFGALLGPIAIVLLAAAPPGSCPRCEEPLPGWPARCSRCGLSLRSMVVVRVPRSWPFAHVAASAVAPRPVDMARPIATAQDGIGPLPAPARSHRAPLGPAERPRVDGRSRRSQSPPALTIVAPTGRPWAHPRDAAGRARAGGTTHPDRVASATTPQSRVGRRRSTPTRSADEPSLVVLATGVYVTGTVGLRPGVRYSINRRGDRLVILGPVDLSPERQQLDWPVTKLDVTVFGERLVIAHEGRMIAFQSLAGVDGERLAVALR